jgi:hypothetical protein
MYVMNGDTRRLAAWIRAEIEFQGDVVEGRRGAPVKRVQEWLTLHGFGVTIDGAFGSVTKRAVQRFQTNVGLKDTGVVDERTFERLVQPITNAVAPAIDRDVRTIEDAMTAYARAHLKLHPIEVGGQNRGPWVRLYMNGREGDDWAWCAGFVTFVMAQAAESMNVAKPIEGSFSCDSLAAQARTAGLFVAEREATQKTVVPGSVFLVRRTATDWAHTGIVTEATDGTFDTIEGNTNDDGHREGFEVCSRSRGFKDKDFIRLSLHP